jgi:histidyl-tRNA synthetase
MERLPGFRDFYPIPLPTKDTWSIELRNYIFSTWRRVALSYGFSEYDGPPLEALELYTLKSGDEIINQLYNFQDKGGRPVALRPEMTPTLGRMIATHERAYKKPIKWFSIPQLFRYERQQKGRLREHFQFNADIIGEKDAAADAEIIALAIDVLRAFGLSENDFVVRLSSRNAWHDFFIQKAKPDVLNKEYDFFQIIDKLERQTPEESQKKLSDLGFSYDDVLKFIESAQPTTELSAIISYLKPRGLDKFIKVDFNVIRGLAYYTGMVFEIFDKKGQFRAIAGGGRYDNLIGLISGGTYDQQKHKVIGAKVDLPALGFGMGDVVLTELLKERQLLPKLKSPIDVYVLIENENLRFESLKLVQMLRDANISVDYPLTPEKPEKQFKKAIDVNATFTVRSESTSPDMIIIKQLATREEIKLPINETIEYLKQTLKVK